MDRLIKESPQINPLWAQLNEDVERAEQAIEDAKLKLRALEILSHVPGFPIGELDRGSFRMVPVVPVLGRNTVLVDVPISALDSPQRSILADNLERTRGVQILVIRKDAQAWIMQLSIKVWPYEAEAHDETAPVGEIQKNIGAEIERRTGRTRTKPLGCGGSEGEGL